MTSSDRRTMPLSSHLGVTHDVLVGCGVLDVLLGTDTKLFIDPKLLERSSAQELQGATGDIKRYFEKLISIQQLSDNSSQLRSIAIRRIAIKEPKGLAIGYGNSRDSGIAISNRVAKQSLSSLAEMLLVGIQDVTVMELMGLFIDGFGRDSISDLVAHIIYLRLCEYTQRIAKALGAKTTKYTIQQTTFELPRHPYKGHQLIFVPHDIVRELPLASSWDEISVVAQENESARDDFNEMIGESMKSFVKRIKEDPSLLTSSRSKLTTLIKVYNDATVAPYDMVRDPAGYDRLVQLAPQLEQTLQPQARRVQSLQEVIDFVEHEIVAQYKRCIENNAGNTLLYHRKNHNAVDPTRPLKEDVAQTLFYLVADILCRVSNVMLSREPNAGQGAVDFSIGTGYRQKVLVEIKKSNNGSLKNGYFKQIERYIENEKAGHGFYVVVVVDERGATNPQSQLNELKQIFAQKIARGEKTPTLVIVDGLIHLSPSKE